MEKDTCKVELKCRNEEVLNAVVSMLKPYAVDRIKLRKFAHDDYHVAIFKIESLEKKFAMKVDS